jgi:hypothetical protein
VCRTLNDAIAVEKILRDDEHESEYAFGWEEMPLLAVGARPVKVDVWMSSTGGVDSDHPSVEWEEPEAWTHGQEWDFDDPAVAGGNVVAQVIIVTNDRKGIRRVDLWGPTKKAVLAAAEGLRERAKAGDTFDDLMVEDDSRLRTSVVLTQLGVKDEGLPADYAESAE